MLESQRMHEVHELPRLLEARKEIVLLLLFVVLLDEAFDKLRGVGERVGWNVLIRIEPADRVAIDEERALEHAVLAHQVFVGTDLFLFLLGDGAYSQAEEGDAGGGCCGAAQERTASIANSGCTDHLSHVIRRACNAHATRAILCAFTAPPSSRPAHVVLFHLLLALVAIVAGGIAAVAGFGIGSLLTPTLAFATGTKLAVAAIAIPHFVATVQRFWILRRHVDRRVLLGFGIASAVGGLAGALAHTDVSSRALT